MTATDAQPSIRLMYIGFGLGGYFDEPDQDDFDYNLIDCPGCDGNDGGCATCGGWGQIREPDEEA